MKYFLCILLTLSLIKSKAQNNPLNVVPIHLSEYGGSYWNLPDSMKLGDTVRVVYSANIYFKFVLIDYRGASYCEVFKNNKLYEKGYYLNSLDTLKTYTSTRDPGLNGRGKGKKILAYFEPLRNGEWIIYKNGKPIVRKYIKGIED
jgi:hypothetical protein